MQNKELEWEGYAYLFLIHQIRGMMAVQKFKNKKVDTHNENVR